MCGIANEGRKKAKNQLWRREPSDGLLPPLVMYNLANSVIDSQALSAELALHSNIVVITPELK